VAGGLTAPTGSTLIETPAAIRHVQEGRARGTIVITIRSARLESTIGVVRCVFW